MAVLSDYVTGTISLTNGSAAFTGTNTAWLAAGFRDGDMILDVDGGDGRAAIVASIISNTSGALTLPWPGPSVVDAAYRIRYQSDGSRVTAQARQLVELLGGRAFFQFDASGVLADRDQYDSKPQGFTFLDTSTDPMELYVKASDVAGDWAGPTSYATGPRGDQGDKGWSPQLVGESDGARRVLKLSGYVGGAGAPPTANVGEYLKADGAFTANIAEAMDYRGGIGADGTDPGMLMTWSELTADADPGAGNIRANNADLSAATTLFISKTNRAGDDMSAWLAHLADSTNPARKGGITLTRSGGNAQAAFDLTGLVDAVGYVKLTVANPAGATGFFTGDAVSFQFVIAGDKGADGAGTGDMLKANNLSDLANKQAAFDNLSLQGANVASAATIDLDAATGSLVIVTGTTATSAITLASGRRRRVVASAAWPITVGANLVLNNGGQNYTCSAGDVIDFWAEGAKIRGTVQPVSGKMPRVVSGPTSSVAGRLATFSDTSGALVGDSGIALASVLRGDLGATDNRLLRSDGTGGVTGQGSAATLDDSGNISGLGNVSLSGVLSIAGLAGKVIRKVQFTPITTVYETTSTTAVISVGTSFSAVSTTSNLLVICAIDAETLRAATGDHGMAVSLYRYDGSAYVTTSHTMAQQFLMQGFAPAAGTSTHRGAVAATALLDNADRRSDANGWSVAPYFFSYYAGCTAKLTKHSYIFVEFEP
ncbi:hypothetical protein [Paradevosia shaoguanensis]|uniref:Uncharacterized protein n=1 Tax=Paradevosia shaoguanensis TaxID=1335043 RepID=A0AA41QRF8_9HYPH|nr:hypothetical protein [Paradevosia shaoguanensis]MCF1744720.1 hypothetical protein [Paradevosia shaoguanensis]MCI0129203.1 hypothetical protein [Paradevosia shaoguanensis]